MNNGIVMNPEWYTLKMREEYLRSKCADTVEVYMHTIRIIGPNLKSLYMVNIGQYECRLFQLKIEIRQWKRRFELRQQALNRGEMPDYIAIEDVLEREFEDYVRQIRERYETLKKAALNMTEELLSDEETTAIRIEYLNAVKKLHPDINPSLPDIARLEDRLKEISRRLNDLWCEEPYIWKHLFENDDEVRVRQNAVKKLIESAEAKVSLYERMWKEER